MQNLKNKQTYRNRGQICGFQRWGWGRLDEGGQKVQTFSYKINKYQGCDLKHDDSYIAI